MPFTWLGVTESVLILSMRPINKILLNTGAKEYRLVLNANFKKYTEKCSDELRSLSKTNTKAFWFR
jgi:hypothetical protein